MGVFKEVYEVIGAAAKKAARAHASGREAALAAQWKLVQSLGAEGFRPGHGGCIKSLLFAQGAMVPPGLRKIGTDKGRNEFRPSGNTKAGKELNKLLWAAPRVEGWGAFADTFGWKGRSPISTEGGRGVIYFCAGVHVKKPRERFFLTYPRELKDGWKPPTGLKLVRESDMMRAIEDHNAAIKRPPQQRRKAVA